MFKPGQSQAAESCRSKRPGSARTADSSGSNAFKRMRTASSALLDLLPLASDASTVEHRWMTPLNPLLISILCCTRRQRMCNVRAAIIRRDIAYPPRMGGAKIAWACVRIPSARMLVGGFEKGNMFAERQRPTSLRWQSAALMLRWRCS